MGPTASGKTELALLLARPSGAVVSADSRQVYRRLDAGTAKPRGAWAGGDYLVEGVPYHLVDIVDPKEVFTAADFVRLAREAAGRSAGPWVMAGGTGLYIEAFWSGLDPLPPRDEELRRRLGRDLEREGPRGLLARLSRLDPAAASRIGPNPQRLIRALEVLELTGRPISEQWSRGRGLPEDGALFVTLEWSPEDLRRRIAARAREMVPAMLEEARGLLELGYSEADPGLQSLGYSEALACARGRLGAAEGLRLLEAKTARYAKRQRTWFRRYAGARRVAMGGRSAADAAAEILEHHGTGHPRRH